MEAAQGHSASRWWRWNSRPGGSAQEPEYRARVYTIMEAVFKKKNTKLQVKILSRKSAHLFRVRKEITNCKFERVVSGIYFWLKWSNRTTFFSYLI